MDPYIGITGFMSETEVWAMLDCLPDESPRQLMVGVLASSKTLAGGTNKYPNRYPKISALDDVFVHDERALNLIHYATDDRDTLGAQLKKIWFSVALAEGFQLNVAWPNPNALYDLIASQWSPRFVLQIGARAQAEANHDPRRLAERLAEYDGLIDGILLDGSGGRGVPLDAAALRPALEAIAGRWPKLGLGVAGGLCAATLPLVAPLLRDFPNLSIDAEGRLRDPSTDSLDLDLARDYVARATKLFSHPT